MYEKSKYGYEYQSAIKQIFMETTEDLKVFFFYTVHLDIHAIARFEFLIIQNKNDVGKFDFIRF